MRITYVPFQRWYKDVIAEPENLYGKKNQKRIRSTLAHIADHSIYYEIKELDRTFLDWFQPLYEKTIAQKNSPIVHDLFAATLGNEKRVSKYWSLTIFEHDQPVGATIIGIREERVMIAFKAFAPKWSSNTLQASPSLYADYIVSKHAFEKGKQFISHGKDRNLYGVNAAIGLAIYKLSTGYTPRLLDHNEVHEPRQIDTSDITTDALILHYPETGEVITTATLLTLPVTEDKYAQLKGYANLLKVNVVYRDEDNV